MSDSKGKTLYFDNEVLHKVAEGVEDVSRAVGATFGPGGRTVGFSVDDDYVITKDGVSVASSIDFSDKLKNLGAQLTKSASEMTVRQAGDGTSNTCIVLNRLVQEAKNKLSTTPAPKLKRELQTATKRALEDLDNYRIEIDVDSPHLYDIVNVSTNNHTELTTLLTNTRKEVGKDGTIVLKAEGDSLKVEYSEGYKVDAPTPKDQVPSEKVKGYVFITHIPITSTIAIEKIKPLLVWANNTNNNLFLVAPQFNQDALITIERACSQWDVNIYPTQVNQKDHKDILEDLAVLTQSTLRKTHLMEHQSLDNVTPKELGFATVDVKPEYMVFNADKTHEAFQAHIDFLNTYKSSPHVADRIGMLTGKYATIVIGASTPEERKEIYDRAEDALFAQKAALRKGIVAGGGITTHHLKWDETDCEEGSAILKKALQEPLAYLAKNVGIDKPELKEYPQGYNFSTLEYVDMVETGIVDPFIVVESIIRNSTSSAAMIIDLGAMCVPEE